VYVVVSDCGLNGPIVHGVYTEPPSQKIIDTLINNEYVLSDGFHVRISGVTGYGGTQVLVGDLNSTFSLVGWDEGD
jgi:hypothetical protein